MNSRQKINVDVYTFINGLDEYGQPRTQRSTTYRTIEMIWAIYRQTPTSDIRFNDVEYLGLTEDKSLTDQNQIKLGNDYYNILHVIPSNRMYQVLMKKA